MLPPRLWTWALDFADRIATAVASAYLDETEQIHREREHRRSALLNVILAGLPSEPIDHPAELDDRHAVVVARVAPDLSLLDLELTGQLLEERAGAALWTVAIRASSLPFRFLQMTDATASCDGSADSSTRGRSWPWASAGTPERGGRDPRELRGGDFCAPGGPLLGATGPPVYDFQVLAPLIALLEHRDRARRFAAGALEPLGGLRNRAWLLPTVESFIAHQGRMKPVAADLGIHLNTVKYRIREVRGVAERCLEDTDTATTILLALQIERVLEAEDATG